MVRVVTRRSGVVVWKEGVVKGKGCRDLDTIGPCSMKNGRGAFRILHVYELECELYCSFWQESDSDSRWGKEVYIGYSSMGCSQVCDE